MLLYFWITYGVQKVAGTGFLGGDGVLIFITTSYLGGAVGGFWIGWIFFSLAMLTSFLIVLSVEQQNGNFSYGTESTFF